MSSSEFLELDSDRLDEQWLEQPRLYHKYARKLANAKQTLEAVSYTHLTLPTIYSV